MAKKQSGKTKATKAKTKASKPATQEQMSSQRLHRLIEDVIDAQHQGDAQDERQGGNTSVHRETPNRTKREG